MVNNKKIAVVMPAYNAEHTLLKTYSEIPFDIVDFILLVDDASTDNTRYIAINNGINVKTHSNNKGYGGNQKTCYQEALKLGADIIVMLHPDYQYTPKLIGAIVHMLTSGEFDVVLGSRILGGGALSGGMPLYKYIANRLLTFVQNILLGAKISEYHTGYRAYIRECLELIPFQNNSDDFVFDNQLLSQIIYAKFRVGEVTCPTKYFPEASSINFSRSVKYGFGCLKIAFEFRLNKLGIVNTKLFSTISLNNKIPKN
jgi:glycosyltransferase involved in cell wall biosynthesis